MADQPIVIEVDSRGRCSLGKLLGYKVVKPKFYIGEVDATGTITLRPAVIVPANIVPGKVKRA